MSTLRKMIKNIILEKSQPKTPAILDSSISEIQSLISTFDLSGEGYNVLSATLEEDTTADLVFTVILQHVKPDFKGFINMLVTRGGKYAQIYSDTPTSKTKITRWLAGYKEGADIDERQKSAAIKVAQLAGLDALGGIVQEIEKNYNCSVVANFVGAKTQKKGQSIFEVFVFDHGRRKKPAELPEPTTEAPTDIIVDDEVIEIEPEPELPKKKKRPSRENKLTSKEKKRGYTQKSQGLLRHVLAEEELESIADHAVNLIIKGKAYVNDELGPHEAHDLYQELKDKSETNPMVWMRIVDDYYDNPLPILKFYSGTVYVGGKIRSKSMMSQYTSPTHVKPDKHGEFTEPKMGSKDVKDARRHISSTRTSDEIIMYARIDRKKNRYTGEYSSHTGDITLYVFLIDRKFED